MVRARITLPKLLATLPSHGQGQLVQPLAWAERFPQSFYKVTRTKLRFRPIDGEIAEASGSGSGSGLQTKNEVLGKGKQPVRAEEEEDEEFEEEEDMFGGGGEEGQGVQGEGNEGRPHGKAWGVLVWNGKPNVPEHNAIKPCGLLYALHKPNLPIGATQANPKPSTTTPPPPPPIPTSPSPPPSSAPASPNPGPPSTPAPSPPPSARQ